MLAIVIGIVVLGIFGSTETGQLALNILKEFVTFDGSN